jgi:hypothetical protein
MVRSIISRPGEQFDHFSRHADAEPRAELHSQWASREVPHVVKPRRSGDPTYLVADPSAARATLNFRPAYSDLATIIRTAWARHKKAHLLKTGGPIEPSRPRTA